MKQYLTGLYLVFWFIAGLVIYELLLFKFPGVSMLVMVGSLIFIFEVCRIFYNGNFKFNLWHLLIVPIMFFASTFVFRTDGFVLTLNFFAMITLMALYALLAQNPKFFKQVNELEFIEAYAKMAVAPFSVVGEVLSRSFFFKPVSNMNVQPKNIAKIAIGIAVTAPIFLVVLGLLVAADEIFANTIGDIFNSTLPDFKIENLFKFIFALFLSGFVLAEVAGFVESKMLNSSTSEAKILDKIAFDRIIPLILTVSLNLIYLLFVIVQFQYLFGGEEFVKSKNLVYANYAVNGFWEMIAVVLINFSILYVLTTRFSLKSLTSKLLLIPSYVFMIFTSSVMIYSSHDRLSTYENAYGFTRDRLIPHAFLIFLAMAMLICLVNLAFTDTFRRKFLIIATSTAVVIFLMGFSLFKIDRFVVYKNVENFGNNTDGVTLDLVYIAKGDSIEGVHALLELKQKGELDIAIQNQYDIKSDVESGYLDRVNANGYSYYCDDDCLDWRIEYTMQKAYAKWGKNWPSWNWQYESAEKSFKKSYPDKKLEVPKQPVYID
jgi:Domain of unknown function (DUF4173)